ncbi:DUF397 domain-containing protein [Streptomyces sp. URMC 124]
MNWRKSTYSSDGGGNCLEVALGWHKSTHSSDAGGNCVEVGAAWHKSSYSDPGGGDCVEVGRRPDRSPVHIRDSKNPTGPSLTLNRSAWASFLGHVKAHIPV